MSKEENKSWFIKWFLSRIDNLTKAKFPDNDNSIKNLQLILPGEFSPVYDNGSSLGRELSDEDVKRMLSDEALISAYINRGKSEIHWHKEKLRHFDLIEKLTEDYKSIIEKIAVSIKKNYNSDKISKIVKEIDVNVPSGNEGNLLPAERKDLIIKLLTLRCEGFISKFA